MSSEGLAVSSEPATWTRRSFLAAGGALTLAAGLGLGPAEAAEIPSRRTLVRELGHRRPKHFGMFLRHTVTHGRRRTALTFDACGGRRGSGYDEALVETLRRHQVPATLFLNARWITTNRSVAAELAADPLFELGSHGVQHRPLTVRGQRAYGIAGTRSVGEAYDEIIDGLDAIAELTGSRPGWFRPGTAWTDDVGVEVARRLHVRVASFSVNVDLGATAGTKVVARNVGKARTRSIALAHANHPEGRTAEGLARALPRLLDQGRHFTTLSDAAS